MNTNNIQINGFNLISDISRNKQQDSDIYKLSKESQTLSNILNATFINNRELSNRLDSIKEIFLRCTKENSSELSLEEKIRLKYAFRDILDEVNLKMHAKASTKNSQQTGPTGFIPLDSQITLATYAAKLLVKPLLKSFTDVPEEDIINKVQNTFVAMERDKRFDRYEGLLMEKKISLESPSSTAQVKNFFSGLFSTSSEGPVKSGEQEANAQLVNQCLAMKEIMEKQHLKKTENLPITRPLWDWEGEFNPLLKDLYLGVVDFEAAVVRKAVDPYTPQNMFEGKNFAEFLTSLLASKKIEVGEDVAQDIRKRLANNLKFVGEDYNLARLGLFMNTQMTKVFSTLSTMQPGSTQEDFIRALGLVDAHGQTKEAFIQKTHEEIVSNLCKLGFLERKQSDETLEGAIQAKWTSLGNAFSETLAASLIRQLFTPQDLMKYVDAIPKLSSSAAPFWGGSDKINAQMPITALFLLNQLIKEMATIASEARKAERGKISTDVSGIADEKAAEEVQKSTLPLVQALKSLLKPPIGNTMSEFLGAWTHDLAFNLLEYAVVANQGKQNLLDIGTPFYQQFIKKWTNWLSV